MVVAIGFERKPCDRLIQNSWSEDPVDIDELVFKRSRKEVTMIKQLQQLLKQSESSTCYQDLWDLEDARNLTIDALRCGEIPRDELRELKEILDDVDDVLCYYLDSEYGWPDYKIWHELLPEELQDPSDKERISKQKEDYWLMHSAEINWD
jgi:hypothetical protein